MATLAALDGTNNARGKSAIEQNARTDGNESRAAADGSRGSLSGSVHQKAATARASKVTQKDTKDHPKLAKRTIRLATAVNAQKPLLMGLCRL
jgi:hypothetical protein